ncbi:unnamed protein product, partial [Ectocarpus sp. 4 AP-2014]
HIGKQPPQQPNQREKLARSQIHCNTAISQQRAVGDACGCRKASVPHAVPSGVSPARVQLITGGAKGAQCNGYFDSAKHNSICDCLLHPTSKSRFSGQRERHRVFLLLTNQRLWPPAPPRNLFFAGPQLRCKFVTKKQALSRPS